MPIDRGSLRRAPVNGLHLPYLEEGEGEPVVFVHGSNSDLRIWDAHRGRIAKQCRMLALTQRYFGKDHWPDDGENFSMDVHAEDLAGFIRTLATGPVTIVGWSYGAAVCLTMAVRNPELVRRMFLYEPALATFVTDAADARAALEDRMAMSAEARPLADVGDLAGALRLFMEGVNAEAGAFDALPQTVRDLMIENAQMLPLLFAGPKPPSVTDTDLRNLEIPVTIVLGEQTRAFYRISASAAQALLPLAAFKAVTNARHLFPVQHPDEFTELVLAFLDQA